MPGSCRRGMKPVGKGYDEDGASQPAAGSCRSTCQRSRVLATAAQAAISTAASGACNTPGLSAAVTGVVMPATPARATAIVSHIGAGSTPSVAGSSTLSSSAAHTPSPCSSRSACSVQSSQHAASTPVTSTRTHNSPGWCPRLAVAYQQHKTASIWMSQDHPFAGEKGSKQFRGFPTLFNFLEYAELMKDLDNPSALYELIPDCSKEVYVYFDSDMKLPAGSAFREALASNLEASTLAAASALISAFEDFGRTFDCGVNLQPGVNCQVAGGSRHARGDKPAKISLHMVCYIRLPSMGVAKSVALAFGDYIMRLPDTDERKQLLTHEPKGVTVPVIDTAPYNKSQNFRMLYSAKRGDKGSMLRPLLGSSPCIGAHLIGVYDTVPAECTIDPNTEAPYLPTRTHITLPASTVARLQPPTQQAPRQATVTRIPGPLARRVQQCASASEHIFPVWPPGHVRVGQEEDGAVEQGLKGCSNLLEALQVQQLEFSAKKLLQPHICSLTVSKECKPVCPYASTAHKSNNICIIYNHNKRLVTVKCLDPDCADQQQHNPVLFHFSPPSGHASTASSLHDYELQVPWADSYSSEVMKPYPADKNIVVAIAARMGLGKTKQMMNTIMGPLCGETALLLTHRRSLAKKYKQGLDDHREHLTQLEVGKAKAQQLPRFTCYLDVEGDLMSEHIIVCVNSVRRVHFKRFGAVFIDEAVGVLSQLTSATLPDHGVIITHIINLLAAADRVYFLDAFADTTIVYEFACLIRDLKGIPSVTWIRNQHIIVRAGSTRETSIILLESSAPKERQAFEAAFLQHVINSLKAGRRVYVPSTTKALCEVVASAVKRSLPGINFQVYTSTTDDDVKDDAIANVNTAWELLDLVVSSNSLESGISYEGTRFTEVVAWAQNCLDRGAPVFSILQQLFRVRNLGPRGRMTVYVSGDRPGQRAGNGKTYPCTSAEVDCMLESTQQEVITYMPRPLLLGARYTVQLPRPVASHSKGGYHGSSIQPASSELSMQQRQHRGGQPTGGHTRTLNDCWASPPVQAEQPPVTPHYALQFDRSSPSYCLLRGALVMRHKSSMHWSNIIISTLQQEYGLPVTVRPFTSEGQDLSEALELRTNARGLAREEAGVPFSPDLLLGPEEYSNLRQLQRAGKTLSGKQRQQLYTSFVFRRCWAIHDDSLFTVDFYNHYVGQASQASIVQDMRRKFYALRRSVEVRRSTTDKLRADMQRTYEGDVAKATLTSATSNRCSDIWHTRLKELYLPAIEAACLLDHMSTNWRSSALDEGKVILRREDLQKGVQDWAAAITPQKYDTVRHCCGCEGYPDKDKMAKSAKDRSQFVTHFLKKALLVETQALGNSKNARSSEYGCKVVHFRQLEEVLKQYRPGALTEQPEEAARPMAAYAFLDDEE